MSYSGSIDSEEKAQNYITQNRGDVCFIGRKYLMNPYFSLDIANYYDSFADYPYPHAYAIDPKFAKKK